MKLAVSTIVYLHGKVLGLEKACQAIEAMLKGRPPAGVPVPLAVETIRSLHRLFCDLGTLAIRIEPNGSSLGKARSRSLQWAWDSLADVWVSCDDDVTATPGTLQTAVKACHVDTPRVVVVPCVLRADNADTAEPNVYPLPSFPEADGPLMRIASGGFGLVVINRAALGKIKEARPTWRDVDGRDLPLIFNCEVSDGEWYGEDISFFRQIPEEIEVFALVRGESNHSGALLELDRLPPLFAEAAAAAHKDAPVFMAPAALEAPPEPEGVPDAQAD
jgi:hypothetical protein